LALAEKFNHPHPAHETRVVLTYIQMAKAIYRIADLMSSAEPSNPEARARLKSLVADLEQAGADNVKAIKIWRTGDSARALASRVKKAMAGTESTWQASARRHRAWK